MKWSKLILRFFIAFLICAAILWAIAYFFNSERSGFLSSPPAILLGAAIIAGIDLIKVVREEG